MRWCVISVAVVALFSACSNDSNSSPTAASSVSSTTPNGSVDEFDHQVLDEIAAKAKAANSYCMLVARDGKIVEQWDFGQPDEPRIIASATKSITNILVGIAAKDGSL